MANLFTLFSCSHSSSSVSSSDSWSSSSSSSGVLKSEKKRSEKIFFFVRPLGFTYTLMLCPLLVAGPFFLCQNSFLAQNQCKRKYKFGQS